MAVGYDLDYRLTSLLLKDGATNVSSLAYAYTDGMNLTGITDNVTAANSNTLGYSLANRLNAATGPWGSKSFGYDGVGNRITDNSTLLGTTTNRTQYYGSNDNRLGSIWENGAQLRSYTQDGAGNIITETRPGESFAYTYNKRNRLASVTRNTAPHATYGYNALEQLTTRTTTAAAGPVGQVAYTYDIDGHLLTEAVAATGAKVREYIWLPSNDNSPVDLPLAVIDVATNTISYVHADHLGRPIRMTNTAKTTVWAATWKPWGEVQAISGSNSNNLRFPGQYFQIETGLHYNHHRMYDPVTGRYTQPDPLRFVDGPSIYAYAKNSPYMFTDREGLAGNSSPYSYFLLVPSPFWWMIPTPPQQCIPNGGLNTPPLVLPGGFPVLGQPSEEDGYVPPKNWNGEKVRNPNGRDSGWPDINGDVWVPTDHNGTHRPHYDVQTPGTGGRRGPNRNVYPKG